MKLETLLLAINSAAGASAGAAVAFGETAEGLALLVIAGVCSVITATYYRAYDNEGPTKDFVVTLLMPFIAGMFFAQPITDALRPMVLAQFNVTLSSLASYGIAGCTVGIVLTPVMRALISGDWRKFLTGVEAAAKALREAWKGKQ